MLGILEKLFKNVISRMKGEMNLKRKEEKLLNNSYYNRYREELINSSGTKIALSIYESNKNDPCIIFIPGTMTHPLFYDEFLSSLAENKFNIVGLHLISHGKSPREKHIYSFDDMIENVKDTISYCLDNFNEEIIVMGSSQGGILSIAVAGMDERIKAVFPHNILLPSLNDSIYVTSIPKVFKPLYRVIPVIMNMGAKIFPKFQIPITAYLKLNRIFTVEETKDQFYQDPIGLTKYPLYFLASLFSANLDLITDGSIRCPVVVISSRGDTLFPYEYCYKVFEKIKASRKEMIIFDEPHHLIFNESVEKVTEPIVKKLNEYVARDKDQVLPTGAQEVTSR